VAVTLTNAPAECVHTSCGSAPGHDLELNSWTPSCLTLGMEAVLRPPSRNLSKTIGAVARGPLIMAAPTKPFARRLPTDHDDGSQGSRTGTSPCWSRIEPVMRWFGTFRSARHCRASANRSFRTALKRHSNCALPIAVATRLATPLMAKGIENLECNRIA
jgi:hypothetical protein